jgi:hypothetical protein
MIAPVRRPDTWQTQTKRLSLQKSLQSARKSRSPKQIFEDSASTKYGGNIRAKGTLSVFTSTKFTSKGTFLYASTK